MSGESKLDRLLIEYSPVMRAVPKELRVRVWRRLACNPAHRFLYVRIPKAANSTVSLTLARLLFPDEARQLENDPEGKAARKLFSNPSPKRYFGARALEKSFFVFSFFRNPYTRVLSAYLDKLRSDENSASYDWVARAAGFDDNQEMTFERFIGYLESGRNRYSNIHWAPQTAICPVPVERLHLIGRVETLQQDLTTLIESIMPQPQSVEILARQHNRQGANEKIQAYYTPELMERVQRLYEADFRLLGYDPAPSSYLQ
ncbi:MAG: sulfotransferase family protein [Ectothiorhodospiraceae bacterium]|nr:sulfotransferase family protein [Ectothiorhodospiraceae bacterium]MCH8503375.1 sulfotransferase family protein [Ectothiorhodospiraceae bacterium]